MSKIKNLMVSFSAESIPSISVSFPTLPKNSKIKDATISLKVLSVVKNENATVTALISKEQAQKSRLEEMVEETFEGSMPAFIAAFSRSKKLTNGTKPRHSSNSSSVWCMLTSIVVPTPNIRFSLMTGIISAQISCRPVNSSLPKTSFPSEVSDILI